MRDGNEQRKEIETIRERALMLKLSDADTVRISEKAASVGLTVSELLERFIGDLVNGTYSSGADERRLARDWFERCGFSFAPEQTFLAHLIEWGDLQKYLDGMEFIEDCIKDLEIETDPERKEALREHTARERETLDGCYKTYASHTEQPQPKEEAIKLVAAYRERLEALREGNGLQ